jgi:hypothetical protein
MDVFSKLAGYFKPVDKAMLINVHELAMKLASDSVARQNDDSLYTDNSDGSVGLTATGQVLFDYKYDEYVDLINSCKAEGY